MIWLQVKKNEKKSVKLTIKFSIGDAKIYFFYKIKKPNYTRIQLTGY